MSSGHSQPAISHESCFICANVGRLFILSCILATTSNIPVACSNVGKRSTSLQKFSTLGNLSRKLEVHIDEPYPFPDAVVLLVAVWGSIANQPLFGRGCQQHIVHSSSKFKQGVFNSYRCRDLPFAIVSSARVRVFNQCADSADSLMVL